MHSYKPVHQKQADYYRDERENVSYGKHVLGDYQMPAWGVVHSKLTYNRVTDTRNKYIVFWRASDGVLWQGFVLATMIMDHNGDNAITLWNHQALFYYIYYSMIAWRQKSFLLIAFHSTILMNYHWIFNHNWHNQLQLLIHQKPGKNAESVKNILQSDTNLTNSWTPSMFAETSW